MPTNQCHITNVDDFQFYQSDDKGSFITISARYWLKLSPEKNSFHDTAGDVPGGSASITPATTLAPPAQALCRKRLARYTAHSASICFMICRRVFGREEPKARDLTSPCPFMITTPQLLSSAFSNVFVRQSYACPGAKQRVDST